jgi:hypothetical protein
VAEVGDEAGIAQQPERTRFLDVDDDRLVGLA